MKPSRYQKIDQQLRDALLEYLSAKLSGGKKKQQAIYVPKLRVPSAGAVDLLLAPTSGLTVMVVQRSDYLATYKHVVGELLGIIGHLHRMSPADLREALERVKSFPSGGHIDVRLTAKRIAADLKAGHITVEIGTDKPELPQTTDQLRTGFLPVYRLLQTWCVTPVKRKTYCAALMAHAIDLSVDPPTVAPLFPSARSAKT